MGITIIREPTPVYIPLYIKAYGEIANFPEATVTFTVGGTGISKTTADHTIFPAHPIFQQRDTADPCFIIRIFPEEVMAVSPGEYAYTLTITYPDVVGLGAPITNTYRGEFSVLGTTGVYVTKELVVEIP